MSPFWILLKRGDGGGGDSWSYKKCKAPEQTVITITYHGASQLVLRSASTQIKN